MLISFSIENFLSIRDNTTLSFLGNESDLEDGWYVPLKNELSVGTALGLFGGNGAGKTVALKGLCFLLWIISGKTFGVENKASSFQREHFMVSSWFGNDNPSRFSLSFTEPSGSRLYQYDLVLSYTGRVRDCFKIIDEKLSYRNNLQSQKFAPIFNRYARAEESDIHISFFGKSKLVKTIKTLLPKFTLSKLVTHDTSVFSALGKLIPEFSDLQINVASNLFSSGSLDVQGQIKNALNEDQDTDKLGDNSEVLEDLNSCIRKIDVGIEVIRPMKIPEKWGVDAGLGLLFCGRHVFEDKRHQRHSKFLPFIQESDGIKEFLKRYCQMRPILKKGGVVLIDELSTSMHPKLVEYLLSFFRHEGINVGKGQLIFSSHRSEIIEVVGPSHIYLTEKVNQRSVYYRMTDIENIRDDIMWGRKYLVGFYGAIPSI